MLVVEVEGVDYPRNAQQGPILPMFKTAEPNHDLRDVIYGTTQLPRTLSESGKVDRSQLEKIADLSVDDGALMFNRVDADRSDVLIILEKAWGEPN